MLRKILQIKLKDKIKTTEILENIYRLLIRDQELRETRDSWKMAQYLFTPKHTKQTDAINCGILILWYCEQIMKGEQITIPVDTLIYRRKIYTIFQEFKDE